MKNHLFMSGIGFLIMKYLFTFASKLKKVIRKSYVVFFLLMLMHHAVMSLPRSETVTSDFFIADNMRVTVPEIVMRNISTAITFEITDAQIKHLVNGEYQVDVNGKNIQLAFVNGEAQLDWVFKKKTQLSIAAGGFFFAAAIDPIPLWLSVLPPLIAILMALLLKEVFTALFTGVFIGAVMTMFYRGQNIFEAMFNGFFAVIDDYVIPSLTDSGHLSIIIFSMLIGGMVGVITNNGGMRGVVNYLSRFAGNARSGQLVTWLLGVLLFFDDYANTLVVGNTMRPVTDRLRVSREKLAYIVDSTAAPIASVAFVTTWIGAELSYIQDGIKTLALDESPYDVFLNSLQYAFYPLLAIGFVFMIIWMRRDFGPMHSIELAARKGADWTKANENSKALESGVAVPETEVEPRWYNAVVPVLVLILGTVAGLIITGNRVSPWDTEATAIDNLAGIIGSADSFSALLWSSLAGAVTAVLLSVVQKLLTLRQSMDALVDGFKTMMTAVLILVLAWSVALITEHLRTAEFISTTLIGLQFSPYLIPALTFVLAASVAFSTGSSWGTMAILYPLILPASWLIGQNAGMDYDVTLAIFHNVVSAVLAGSVLGDHCSPISDTTILSSLASSCNHISHVRTQMPYALTVGAVAIVFGTIPAAYGVSSLILFPLNFLILYLIVRYIGKQLPVTYLGAEKIN
jgi:Na+/H+ antiporter NhaC